MKTRLNLRFVFALLLSLVWMSRCVSAEDGIDFNREIRPILSDKCFHCHGPDNNTREAGLRLDSFEGATEDLGGTRALVPGDVAKSELVRRIDDADDPMPPLDSHRRLSEEEKSLLRKWVRSGGKFATHWSFVSPHRPDVPSVDVETKNPIDAFVARRLWENGLGFSKEADPATLIRRLSLDLNGVPPTIEAVDAFVADYTSPGSSGGETALSKWIDRLIHSPRYGETMALPWLDAARFADTDGYQYDGPRYQWRWRDWVIGAYNRNMPFDQFTIEQLGGDLIPNASLEQQIATAFNRNHRYNSEAGLVVEEFLLENAVDRVDTTSTLWMGLTVGCARCHDHKFDPISQKDYYQLIAFFNSIPEAGRAVKAGNSEPVIHAPTMAQQEKLSEMEHAVSKAKSKLRPSGTPQQGGLLIDRKLAHHFALDRKPGKDAKLDGEPVFKDSALVLDGQSSIEFSSLKKSVNFRANTSFTISCWIRTSDLSDGVILSRLSPGTTRPGVELSVTAGGHVQFDLITRWVAGVGRTTTLQTLAPNQWTHLAVTNDGSNSAYGQHIYLNGHRVSTEVSYNTNSNVGGVKPDRPLEIGHSIRPDAEHLIGAVRDVRVYETDLWPEEIEVLGDVRGSELRKRFSCIKTTQAFRDYVRLRERLLDFKATLPTVMVMKEAETAKQTFIRTRGVYDKLGEPVSRQVPSAFDAMDDSLPRNRLGLAKWLVSGDHPLTARVAVNRYWQKYFGKGLVATPEDFGTQSQPPSHPELLDWLAVEFVESGWDIAAMQKLIVSSRTYRQQSSVTEKALRADPGNRWLSHAPRLRLSGHAIRDQALFVSGLLTQQIGGPSVSPYQPQSLWAEMSMGMKYKTSKGSDLFRRSLYTIWKRTVAPPTMAVFDAADRESCWVGRKQTNTPLQALALLNETAFVESARHLAVRMLDHESDPIEFGFRLVASRPPHDSEHDVLRQALDDYRTVFRESPSEAKQLIAVGESPEDKKHDPIELAAYTTLANVLLNLDEVITRE